MNHCALRGLAAGAFIFGVSVLPSAAFAEEAGADANEVLVPGTRLEQTAFKLPASVTVISAEQIATSPAQTVADLLDTEAGVHVRSLFGNRATRATVDLRGFGVTGGQNTVILLDGRRLNDVDLATVNFAAIPLHNVERIEIVRGSGSVLYGDGASGGSINIVTRRPQREELAGSAGVSGGSYNTAQIDGRLSYGGKRSAVNLAVDGVDSDGYRDNNDLKQRDVQLDWRFDGATAGLYAKAGYSDQELGLPGVRTVDPAFGLDELRDDPRGTITPRDYAEERAGYLTIGLARSLGAHGGLLADAGYRDRRQKAFFDDYVGFPPFSPPGTYADYLDTHLRSFSVTPRVYFDHALFGADSRLTAGVDFYDHDYDSDRALNARAAPIHRLRVEQRNTALYLNHLSHPAKRLTMNLGARVQRVHFEARDGFDPAAPGALDKFESGAAPFSTSDTAYMLEAGWRYAFTDAVDGFVRAGRSARFATVDELFEIGPTFTREFSRLDPQTARHADVGVEFATGPWTGSLTAYAMNLDDEIHFNPVSFTNENLDPTHRRGFEADLRVQATERLALRANYSMQHATFRAGPFDGNDVPVVPRRLANVSALWTIVPDVDLAATWHYVGEKHFDNDETGTFGRNIPAYDLLDAKLTVQFSGWTATAMVNNLLDEEAFDYGVASTFSPGRYNGYPLPGRNFLVGLSRSFK